VAGGAETLEYFVKIWSLGKSRKCLNLQIGGLMVAHDDVHILLGKELCVNCFKQEFVLLKSMCGDVELDVHDLFLGFDCCCWICALDGFDVVMGFVGLL
jgi:hypothetical protein